MMYIMSEMFVHKVVLFRALPTLVEGGYIPSITPLNRVNVRNTIYIKCSLIAIMAHSYSQDYTHSRIVQICTPEMYYSRSFYSLGNSSER